MHRYSLIADFHLHSKYARACSPQLTIEQIRKTAIIKGVDIIGTGDCTHPDWFGEISEQCVEVDGLLVPRDDLRMQWIEEIMPHVHPDVQARLRDGHYPRYILSTEINNVFARGSGKKPKKYRIHNCLLIRGLEDARAINEYLSQYGKVESDGRLAVRQDQTETLRRLKTHYPSVVFFPAHIWTPYFGVLGSRSFASMRAAFGESYPLIDCIETGLSSDPLMQRVNPELDPFCIVSNSDAHSLPNLAREGTIITTPKKTISYDDIARALKRRKYDYFAANGGCDSAETGYLADLFGESCDVQVHKTIEFYPQEGKYFGDGCAADNYPTTPAQTVAKNGRSPISGKKLTIGVLHRTYTLADDDRKETTGFGGSTLRRAQDANTFAPHYDRPPYDYIVPMRDVIKDVRGANKGTKTAARIYNELIQTFGPEFFILRELPIDDASRHHPQFGEALRRLRSGEIAITPGYDGVFGVVDIFADDEDSDTKTNNHDPTAGMGMEPLF